MSARQRSLFAVALLLGLAFASATPAAAQIPDHARGIWVHTGNVAAWTLTVINLTSTPLYLNGAANPGPASIFTNNSTQLPVFYGYGGNGTSACNAKTAPLCFPIAPYRTLTWKSNIGGNTFWDGALDFGSSGLGGRWIVTLNFNRAMYSDEDNMSMMYGTWVYLTANFDTNPDWNDPSPNNISCSYPGWYDTMYNVMTLSGTDLAVTLYAPYVTQNKVPKVDLTLVFRQRRPDSPRASEDPLVMPCLRYLDNDISYPPVSHVPQ